MPRKKHNPAAGRRVDAAAIALDRFDSILPADLARPFLRAAAEPQTWQSAWLHSVADGHSRLPEMHPAVVRELIRQYAAMHNPPPGSNEHFEDSAAVCLSCGLRYPRRLPVPGGVGAASCPHCGDGESHFEHAPPKDAPWLKLAAAESAEAT